MKPKLLRSVALILAAGGVILAVVLGGLYLAREKNPPAAIVTNARETFAKPGTVPIGGPFTLVDQSGKTVTDKDFRGKYLLVFFGYTHCPDVCPTTMNAIAQTLGLLGKDAKEVQPLFISVDPERDTAEALAEYVKAFDPRIVGLTGTKVQIDEAVKAYRVFYKKVSSESYYGKAPQRAQNAATLGKDYLVSHSAHTYLMSPQGQYLTHFPYGTKPEKMAATIRKAIAKFGVPNG